MLTPVERRIFFWMDRMLEKEMGRAMVNEVGSCASSSSLMLVCSVAACGWGVGGGGGGAAILILLRSRWPRLEIWEARVEG